MSRTLGAVLVVGIVALPNVTARSQEGRPRIVLQDVEVAVSGGRLVLSTANGESYELAALETPDHCPAAGGGTWACGEGARETLASAVAGEELECSVLDTGPPPIVECSAQTRNLNVWMLEIGRATLHPDWAGRSISYDDAAEAARAAGALAWYIAEDGSPPTEPPGSATVPASEADDGAGKFLLRRQEGNVRTYVLAEASGTDTPPLNYVDYEEDLADASPRRDFPLDDNYVPALDVGEFIVHGENGGGRLSYAQASPADDLLPLAYIVGSEQPEGRRYSTIVLDDMAWTSRRSNLQPSRAALGTRVERRGATDAERSAIAPDLPAHELRAGVWTFDAFRVVVAEDAFGCVRYTWCRFAVLDDTGVVVSGTAREAPELALPNGDAASGTAAEEPALWGLIWQAPGDAWRLWRP